MKNKMLLCTRGEPFKRPARPLSHRSCPICRNQKDRQEEYCVDCSFDINKAIRKDPILMMRMLSKRVHAILWEIYDNGCSETTNMHIDSLLDVLDEYKQSLPFSSTNHSMTLVYWIDLLRSKQRGASRDATKGWK